MRKIGILGGAFNPPTTGHIKLAKHVLENTDVKGVWLTPCYGHLYGKDLVLPIHRINMCRAVSNTGERIQTFDYEIRHKMDGSTYDFANKLLNDPELDVDISFIIGQDNANSFHKFKNADKLKEIAKFIVVGRAGIKRDPNVNWYFDKPHTFLPWENMTPCSSTLIRDHIKENDCEPHELLDDRVLEYIKTHQLYSVPNMNEEESEDLLKKLTAFNEDYYSK
jgi:nicotinate-nucleotide adenylyltransferase